MLITLIEARCVLYKKKNERSLITIYTQYRLFRFFWSNICVGYIQASFIKIIFKQQFRKLKIMPNLMRTYFSDRLNSLHDHPYAPRLTKRPVKPLN